MIGLWAYEAEGEVMKQEYCGIKSYNLSEVTVKVIRRFGRTCHLRRQGKK